MKLKTDENLPVEVAEMLRLAGHDALSVLEQDLGGWADPGIASICHAAFRLADAGDAGISPSSQILFQDRERVVTRQSQHLGDLDRQVFVRLELHAVAYAGSATTRSRASSAA